MPAGLWRGPQARSRAMRFASRRFSSRLGWARGGPFRACLLGSCLTRYESESARIRKRPTLESVAFQFPAQANAPEPENKKHCPGVASKTALHKPSLTVASVLLLCAWSLFAFVCCGAERVRAVSARAVPTSIPRATRFGAGTASKNYSQYRPMPQCRETKIRALRACIVSDRDGQRPTDETDKHAP